MIELGMQLVLALLLAMTIAWCVLVHFRLRRLRADRGEMAEFVAALDAAADRAEQAIAQMRAVGEETRDSIHQQMGVVRERSAELGRLIENADRAGRRLEATIAGTVRRTAEYRTAKETAAPLRRDDAAADVRRVSVEPEAPAKAREQKTRSKEREALAGIGQEELLRALKALR